MKLTRGNSFKLGFEYDLHILGCQTTIPKEPFRARLEEWEARGLYVYLLPAYSPELNLIEILWRMIKYHWLPLSAYGSFKDLLKSLLSVLKDVGSKYQINFAH
jgi:transposase